MIKMAGYVYNDSMAVERELGLLLFCWDYWKAEARREIEDAVSEVSVKEESVDEWVEKFLCELSEKRQSRYNGHSRKR